MFEWFRNKLKLNWCDDDDDDDDDDSNYYNYNLCYWDFYHILQKLTSSSAYICPQSAYGAI